jgi:hypothetical protein
MAALARDEEAWWQGEMARLAAQLLLPGRPVRGGGRAAGRRPGAGLTAGRAGSGGAAEAFAVCGGAIGRGARFCCDRGAEGAGADRAGRAEAGTGPGAARRANPPRAAVGGGVDGYGKCVGRQFPNTEGRSRVRLWLRRLVPEYRLRFREKEIKWLRPSGLKLRCIYGLSFPTLIRPKGLSAEPIRIKAGVAETKPCCMTLAAQLEAGRPGEAALLSGPRKVKEVLGASAGYGKRAGALAGARGGRSASYG